MKAALRAIATGATSMVALIAVMGLACADETQVRFTCELAQTPEHKLEFDRSKPELVVVWRTHSHDGSVKLHREPLVDAQHASGYAHDFDNACQHEFKSEETGENDSGIRLKQHDFSYFCPDFTSGSLKLSPDGSGYFLSETKFGENKSVREFKLKNCK